jgi:hypothetical protein
MDKRQIIASIDPAIAIKKTEAINSHWVTSGTVSFPVSRGDDLELGTLEIPFHDAESREDAFGQAAAMLDTIVAKLTDCVAQCRSASEDGKQGRPKPE